MKIAPRTGVSPGQFAAEEEVQKLIGEIQSALDRAERRGVRGCAELRSALVRAQRVQEMLSADRKNSELNWSKLTWTLEFLLRVVKEICSSLYWIFPSRSRYGNWVYHKASPNKRGSFAI